MADPIAASPACCAWTWRGGDRPEALVLEERPMEPLRPHQARVENQVIGLNPVDWKVLGRMESWAPGHTPGFDGAGVVVEVGSSELKKWIGCRVAYHQGLREQGSFSTHTAIAARALIALPDAIDMRVAASFPCPALTAWMALSKLPAAFDGSSLLIGGAGGSVGHYLTQLAHGRGWSVTTMSHARHWARLKQLGATATVGAETGAAAKQRFHAVIDMVDADHARELVPLLRANGHLVAVQGRAPAGHARHLDKPFPCTKSRSARCIISATTPTGRF